jgi:hypothetical protein
VVILAVFLVGMVAFAIDTGYVAVTRTRMQAAADAGALAGAEKLAYWPGQPVPTAAARDEARRFVQLNESLTVRDEDLRLLRYDPAKPAGQRVSTTYSMAAMPNAMEVTVRRDDLANGSLQLFFGPILGHSRTDVRARATAYILPAKGVKPGAPFLPYTMQIDYYFATLGQVRTGVDGRPITVADNWTVRPDGSVAAGGDGVRECVLFSSTHNRPGNFGSLDIGSSSNGTPELRRQILYGPTTADFQESDFRNKVATDGALYTPFDAGGDTGISTSAKEPFDLIAGQPRIIPLYDVVAGTGDNAVFHIVAYAAVTVLSVDFNGSPKRLWVQPSRVITNKVAPGDLSTGTTYGVFTPPKLVIP